MASDWDWDDTSSYIKLPFNDPLNCNTDPNWLKITAALTDLSAKCENRIKPTDEKHRNVPVWLRDTISEYNKKAKEICNFGVIEQSLDIRRKLINVLPVIIDYALSLPKRIKRPIEILQQGENMSISLERNLICSLLANAFMSTFPKQRSPRGDLPSFNFWRLFHNASDSKSPVKHEKLKCILEYFEQMGSNRIPNTNLTFQRRCLSTPEKWGKSTECLCDLCVSTGKIENATQMLQVDFANKVIGGGVITGGAVQEEIRFAISPELIAARLFTEELSKDEVVVITGSRQFSSYTGYGQTFTFKKLEASKNPLIRIVDSSNREYSQVVAMDAIPFKTNFTQYKKDNIDRELHKSYAGFIPDSVVTQIATGNWGCGAFGGDPELKFIIQWMAASQNNRKVLYHARDENQRAELESMKNVLVSKQVTLGSLYHTLMKFERESLEWSLFRGVVKKKSVFEFLRESLS